jgi:tetratricopeptide (TPR) repeat protein
MQLSDSDNVDSFCEDADGRQLDCQLRMLKRLSKGCRSRCRRFVLAILQVKLGKYNESLAAYNKSLELDPRLDDAWNGKGNVPKAIGHITEANAASTEAKEPGHSVKTMFISQ